jgi:hypothetical protein
MNFQFSANSSTHSMAIVDRSARSAPGSTSNAVHLLQEGAGTRDRSAWAQAELSSP